MVPLWPIAKVGVEKMAEQTSIVKLYEALEMESLKGSAKPDVAPVVRETVKKLFEETGNDKLLLSAVHKVVKKITGMGDLQYSTVASAVKAKKSGYALEKDEDDRVFVVLVTDDGDSEE